jgi:hypothetical protein
MAGQGEQSHEYQKSPYGPMAARVGTAALDALEWLSVDPHWHGGKQRHWKESDHESFWSTLECAHGIREAGASRLIEGVIQGPNGSQNQHHRLVMKLARFHHSLPFDEAQRDWLLRGVYNDTWLTSPNRPTIQQISCQAYRISSAGQHQEVRGKDLLDRWWAWRRRAFEFEGERTIWYAQSSLQGIGEMLVPRLMEERRVKSDIATAS